jgi:hypothetical protein
MAVISIISVNIIAPLITGFEVGFSLNVWADTLKVIPIIWIAVIALVLFTHKPAEWLTTRIIKEGDSFSTHMIINTLCTVFLMSIFMTVIGSWIGMRHISMEPIQMFFYKWPRNAAISFIIEAFIAQPIARFVMLKFHQNTDSVVEQA